ncbi:MAG: hypothetical protein LBH25_05550 [Fibromonadaceae bacterium]|jgi:hypothetical protein|nr:hypothetical protein [Fibromonadaceae bacterium]
MGVTITEKASDLRQKMPEAGEVREGMGETKEVSPGDGAAQKSSDSEAYKISFSDNALNELSDQEQQKVENLKKIDKNVHIHEQAHLGAAGGYARGGASYEYVTGPDGKRYANAGHVNLDTGKEKTPEATIKKADVIRRAALAPADPSPADRQIAANATKMAQEAQREISDQQQANGQNKRGKAQDSNNEQKDTPTGPEQQRT